MSNKDVDSGKKYSESVSKIYGLDDGPKGLREGIMDVFRTALAESDGNELGVTDDKGVWRPLSDLNPDGVQKNIPQEPGENCEP